MPGICPKTQAAPKTKGWRKPFNVNGAIHGAIHASRERDSALFSGI
jgi:hypothetical protein